MDFAVSPPLSTRSRYQYPKFPQNGAQLRQLDDTFQPPNFDSFQVVPTAAETVAKHYGTKFLKNNLGSGRLLTHI